MRPFSYTETLQKKSALLLKVYGVSTFEFHFNFFSSGMRSWVRINYCAEKVIHVFDNSVMKQILPRSGHNQKVRFVCWSSFIVEPYLVFLLDFVHHCILWEWLFQFACSISSSFLSPSISNFISHWRLRGLIGGLIVCLRTRSCVLTVGWVTTRFPTMYDDAGDSFTSRYQCKFEGK